MFNGFFGVGGRGVAEPNGSVPDNEVFTIGESEPYGSDRPKVFLKRVSRLVAELESHQRFWCCLAYFELGGYRYCR